MIFIKAGTLDDPSWVKPDAHIWCAEKLPWVVIEEGPAQMPGNPTYGPKSAFVVTRWLPSARSPD